MIERQYQESISHDGQFQFTHCSEMRTSECEATILNETIDLLLNHKSVRKYTDKPILEEIRNQIIACAQMAPSSSNMQTYTIIEVHDTAIREKMMEISGGQRWVTSAPMLLVFCADLQRANRYFKKMDATALGNTELFTVAIIDTALAAQKALIAAQSFGLGGVIVGGIRNDVNRISQLLQLPDLVFPAFAMCLGYPAENPDMKPRLQLDIIRRHDCYELSDEAELMAAYDKTMQQYYAARETGSHIEPWSERCGQLITDKRRAEVDTYLKKAGFLKQRD